MNITEIIKNRRATSPKFLGKQEVPKETIWQLLENANWAPNHKKTEPWRFKVYTGAAKLKLAGEIYSYLSEKMATDPEINTPKVEQLKSNIERAPVVMAVIVQHNPGMLPEWEEIAAISMAVQNMWLTATEMGLGAFWGTPSFMNLLEPLLQLKENQHLHGFFYVGQIAIELPSPGRGEVREKVEWNE